MVVSHDGNDIKIQKNSLIVIGGWVFFGTGPTRIDFFSRASVRARKNVPKWDPFFVSTKNEDPRAESVPKVSPWWFRVKVATNTKHGGKTAILPQIS